MGLFDDDESEVVQADPSSLIDAWDSIAEGATDWAEETAAEVGETAQAGYETATQAQGVWDATAAAVEAAAVDAASTAYDSASTDANSWVDKQIEIIEGTPDDLARAADRADVWIDEQEAELEADPAGYAFEVLNSTNPIQIEVADDGAVRVEVDAGIDLGPLPSFKGHLDLDADGNVTDADYAGKVTIPMAGMPTIESQGGFAKTEEGWTGNLKNTVGVEVEGVDLKLGVHAKVEDRGDHGYSVKAGPHVGSGVGTGEYAPEFDAVELEGEKSYDLVFAEDEGQTDVGVTETTTVEAKVMGETVASVTETSGVVYSTGPEGETVTVNQSVEGQVGDEKLGTATSDTFDVSEVSAAPVIEAAEDMLITATTPGYAVPIVAAEVLVEEMVTPEPVETYEITYDEPAPEPVADPGLEAEHDSY